MIVYFAGATSQPKMLMEAGVTNILFSYYYCQEDTIFDLTNHWRMRGIKPMVFLDSGGHEALMHNATIDMSKYALFIEKNKSLLQVVANFDPSSTQDTDENIAYLEGKGLQILPVYHIQDPYERYLKMISEYDYVAIGGLVWGRDRDMTGKYLRRGIDDAERRKTKLHAFGMTSYEFMKTFDLYSVDSTSWLVGAQYGYFSYFDPRKGFIQFHWKDKEIYRFKDEMEKNKVSYIKVSKGEGWEISFSKLFWFLRTLFEKAAIE